MAFNLCHVDFLLSIPIKTMNGDIYVVPYLPGGVKHIITTGGSHCIGFVNESTILKYPHFKGTSATLRAEYGGF